MAAKKRSAAAAKKKVSPRAVLGGSTKATARRGAAQPEPARGGKQVSAARVGAKALVRAASARPATAKAPAAKLPAAKLPAAKLQAAKSPAAKSAAVSALGAGKKKVTRRPATAALRAAQKAPAAQGSAEDAASPLQPGDEAPSFELPDQHGAKVSSASLAGQPYVLYFYPKDDTPGCTTQACGFRDSSSGFESAGVRVLGVSPDSVASHQKFASKYGLPFTLLSDASRELASAYGVWALKKNYGREFMGIVRSTFLVDGEGVIRKVWRGVRVNGHVPAVQAAAAELS